MRPWFDPLHKPTRIMLRAARDVVMPKRALTFHEQRAMIEGAMLRAYWREPSTLFEYQDPRQTWLPLDEAVAHAYTTHPTPRKSHGPDPTGQVSSDDDQRRQS